MCVAPLVALREPVAGVLHFSEGFFVAHEDLGLHAADAGEGRELLKQVAEQIAAAPAFQNLVDRLKRCKRPVKTVFKG